MLLLVFVDAFVEFLGFILNVFISDYRTAVCRKTQGQNSLLGVVVL